MSGHTSFAGKGLSQRPFANIFAHHDRMTPSEREEILNDAPKTESVI